MEGNQPLPQKPIVPKTNPIKILREVFCSALLKGPIIIDQEVRTKLSGKNKHKP